MSKIIDFNNGKDRLDQKKIDDIIYRLVHLNKLPGIHREAMIEIIDNVLDDIKNDILDYYDGCYDEDEPNIASFNTQELLKDLIDVACGNAIVKRED